MWVTLSRGGATDKLYLIFHMPYRIHKRLHCQSRAHCARMIDIQPAIQLTPTTSENPTRSRVPLHELKMLTQSVTNREYVHAYTPISVRNQDSISNNFIHNLFAICFSQALIEGAPMFMFVYTCIDNLDSPQLDLLALYSRLDLPQ